MLIIEFSGKPIPVTFTEVPVGPTVGSIIMIGGPDVTVNVGELEDHQLSPLQ